MVGEALGEVLGRFGHRFPPTQGSCLSSSPLILPTLSVWGHWYDPDFGPVHADTARTPGVPPRSPGPLSHTHLASPDMRGGGDIGALATGRAGAKVQELGSGAAGS